MEVLKLLFAYKGKFSLGCYGTLHISTLALTTKLKSRNNPQDKSFF